MLKLMKKFPGGTLLIPMLISSIIGTFFPKLFLIGGPTEALFSGQGLNFILGSIVMLSGCSLNLSSIVQVFKRYGIILSARLLFNTIVGILFVKLFGLDGVLGLSAIAFIVAITSMNPSLFLALSQDYGDEVDQNAFGLLAAVSTPIVPMFIYGLISPTPLDFMSLVSIVIPLIIGIVIGNLDKELGAFLTSGMGLIIILLGWSVGAKINLLDATKAGLPGILMVVLYYLLAVLPVFVVERTVLKRKGISSIAISTMAGLSASVPLMMLENNPELIPYSGEAAAVVTLGVIGTAIISPMLINWLDKRTTTGI